MNEALRTLIVEDSEDDARLVALELARSGYEPQTQRVETAEGLRAALASPWDLVVSDYSLPRFDGLAALAIVREIRADLPVVIVSGAIGEETAVAAMKAGATDYVMKEKLGRLGPVVERALREVENRRERDRMEAQLRASERLQLVGQLVLGVAHEIRNPLNCISAVAEVLNDELGDDVKHREAIGLIREQVTRMADVVSDLLDMGKPGHSSRMHRSLFTNLCDAGVGLWKESQSRRHPVRLRTIGRAAAAAEVIADGARFQRVLINLLDNAAQNSPPGNEILVEIDVPSSDRQVRARVIDSGRGIAPENSKRLFEPFFTTRRGGTGLGLCIVQRIMQDHNGEILLSNNVPGPGCTAEVRLPLAPEEEQT